MGDFVGAGKSVGIELWRIEKLKPTRVEMNGKLFSGDSYILLSTTMKGNAMNWHIHFWLGDETSQDEAGIAAYKTVELDDSLGGGPIQHRECQGHESELFLSYFKTLGLEYLKGGIDSGFNKVERDVYRTRLLQCKGKRTVRATECAAVAASSLNKGDVFILDLGLQLYIYNGADANKYEKAKGAEVARKLHAERGAKGTIVLLDDYPNDETFWGALGGQIDVTDPGDDDEKASQAALADVKLLHLSDSSGAVVFEPVARDAGGNFTRDMLDTNDAYILDTGDTGIFCWTGKKSSKTERREVMIVAAKFVSDAGRPKHTPIERVVESGESAIFKSFFKQFDPILTPAMMKATVQVGGVAAAVEDKAVDLVALHAAKAAEEAPVDDGNGKLEIWRVEDFKKVPVAPEAYGQFYSGDSYVLLYAFKDARKKDAWIIYFWQGQLSTPDEIGASALLAKELDDSMGGAPVQVRVVQGKEPAHFRALFKGAMVIHAGGKASGFKNSAQEDEVDDDGVSLFHVRGSKPENVVGVQVAEKAASLNSMDCFVLLTPSTVYSWRGKGALDAEVTSADKIAGLVRASANGLAPGAPAPDRPVVAVAEGSEDDAFWEALGGKGPYAAQPADEPMPCEPRLFQCTDRFGSFGVEEVAQFGQEDMLEDDVYMLDVGTAVYVWLGSGANMKEKAGAFGVAANYVLTATDGRDKDGPIITVSAGNEPLLFTQFFPNWDHDKFTKAAEDPYAASLAAMSSALSDGTHQRRGSSAKEVLAFQASVSPPKPPPASPAGHKAGAEASPASPALKYGGVVSPSPASPGAAAAMDCTNGGEFKDPAVHSCSYEALTGGVPAGVNPTCKEQYLSDTDFASKFGMDKASFNALAGWKRKAAKEKTKLF